MRLKKLGAALVVAAAIGAVLASNAFAVTTAMTKDVQWYTGASPGTLLSGSQAMKVRAVGAGTFTTHVAGVKYVLESKKVSCVGCKIENSGGVAVGSGKLKFEEVSVEEPAGCSVASTIETNELSVTADWMGSKEVENPVGSKKFETVETATNYIKFVPTKGETTAFATVEITGCASATSIVPKGTVFVESANATSTQAVEQEVKSSEAINAAAGGTLHVGTESAVLSASAIFETSTGVPFGTH